MAFPRFNQLKTGVPRRRYTRRCRILVVEVLEDRSLLSVGAGGAIHLLGTPNDPSFGSQWDMSKIQAPAAWNTTAGSLKVVVADIDTGIDYTHPDLYKNVWINQNEIPATQKANILANYDDGDGLITFWDLNSPAIQGHLDADTIPDSNGDSRIDARDVLAGWSDSSDNGGNGYIDDLVGWNFVANNNNPFDDNGHGTHTAGTIGAVGNNSVGVAGVNWQVQIMALKILNASGGGDLFDATDAIFYANANGAKVSNNSWGFYDRGESVTGAKYTYLYQAIQTTPNVLFVAAAGNNGLNNDTHWGRNYPSSYNLTNIVAVAATTVKDTKASFSNYGATTVDLGAPGLNILSTVPGGYAYYSGTSMATPHVAGAAALVYAKNSGLDAPAVKAAILGGVDIVSSMSKTVSKGRLNLFKTLEGVVPGSGQASSGGSSGSSTGSGSGSSTGSSRSQARAGSQSVPFDDLIADDQEGSGIFLFARSAFPGQAIATHAPSILNRSTNSTMSQSTASAWSSSPSWMTAGSGASESNIDSEDVEEFDWSDGSIDVAASVFSSTVAATPANSETLVVGQQDSEVNAETPIDLGAAPSIALPSVSAPSVGQDQDAQVTESRSETTSHFTRTLANAIGLVGAVAFFGFVSIDRSRQTAGDVEKKDRKVD